MPIALSPGGELVASRGPGEVVQLHAAAEKSEPRQVGRHSALIRAIAFSPDGKRVASASEDRTAKLWDVESGRELMTFQGHTSKVTSVAFSPDGQLAATRSDDGTLRIWGTQTGQALLVIGSNSGPPEAVAFSPDGTRVATAFKDLVVYQLEGRIGRQLPGHGFIHPSLAFHQEPLCWNTLGVVHYRLGQWKDAAESFRESTRINPAGPTAYDLFFQAMTHWQTGEREQARECYDQAVSWSRERTRIPLHEVAELGAIRVEANSLFTGDAANPPKP